jgi:hypothetical protein
MYLSRDKVEGKWKLVGSIGNPWTGRGTAGATRNGDREEMPHPYLI